MVDRGDTFRVFARRASSNHSPFLCGPLRRRVAALTLAHTGGRLAISGIGSARLRFLSGTDESIERIRHRAINRRGGRSHAHGEMDAGL